jgi:hypothetical protein
VRQLQNQICDGLVELMDKFFIGRVGVLKDIMQDARAEGLHVVGHVLQDAVNLDYVGEEIWFPLVVELPFMSLARKFKGLVYQPAHVLRPLSEYFQRLFLTLLIFSPECIFIIPASEVH